VLGADERLSSLVVVPLPSVPPPDGLEPCSTVVLAEMIACRNGCTLSETLVMTTTAPSAAASRSPRTLHEAARPCCGSRPVWRSQ
jgi:hypothetical protein